MGKLRSHKKKLDDNRAARNRAAATFIKAVRSHHNADPVVNSLAELNKPYHPWQGRFERGHKDSDEVIINRYSPARDVACAIVGVPYGTVGVATAMDGVVSHEFRIDSNDASCYHTTAERRADRTTWSAWELEKKRKEDELAERLQASLEVCGI